MNEPSLDLSADTLGRRLAPFLSRALNRPLRLDGWRRFPAGFSWITLGLRATPADGGEPLDLILRIGDPRGLLAPYRAEPEYRALEALQGLASLPVGWHFLMPYQRDRILTFLDPESDPLGAGWNIIQSKIAIGSGGLTGKGWGQGSQSHLDFLPEHTTDFVFSVLSEEFGWVGVVTVLALYLFVVGRCLWIATQARDGFARLLAGTLAMTFSVYVVVNGGMVAGLLPVVGVPMPLVSFGGTSAVSLLVGFGMVMSVHAHRKFMAS